MADFVFNISKGKVAELIQRVVDNDPAASEVNIMLLQASAADATAQDYDTYTAVLGDAGTTEANFTNYARKEITNPTVAVDDAQDRMEAQIPDQTWTAAGNGTNNTLTDLVVGYDPLGTNVDANIIPLTQHDFAVTTDGNDLTADFTTNVDFFRAA